MELTPLRIVMAAGIAFVIVGLAYEIRRWRSGACVTSRQKAFRSASALLLIAIMGMVFAGDRWLSPYGPLIMISYWALCVGFASSLVVLALLDIRETINIYGEERKQAYRSITRPEDDDKSHE